MEQPAFIAGAMSEAAKEYHQQGMHSKKDMIAFAEYCYHNDDDGLTFEQSFEEWIKI